MLAPTQSVATGLMHLALATAVPVLAFYLLLNAGRISAGISGLIRPTPPPAPARPPIEALVRDLRRLAREMATVPQGATQVRRRGLQLAYDEALVSACAALEVEHRLSDSPLGWTRDLERLRVESALESCGVRIHPIGT